MPIRYKLLLILTALFLVAIVSLTIYQDRREKQHHLDIEIASWKKIGEGMVRTWNSTMLYTGSKKLACEQIFKQKKVDELLSIELKRNKKLKRINPDSSPYVSTELEKQVITEGKPAFKILSKNGHQGRRLLTLVPIKAKKACIRCHLEVNNHHIHEGEVMGLISLLTSLQALDTQIASNRETIIFILLAIFLVTIVISYLTINRFTRPITKLTKASEAMAAGNLEVRVPTTSNDELGVLGSAFNTMVQRVKESRDALEAYSRRLEEKVAERTRELKVTALFAELDPAPVLRIDSNGTILHCNPAAEKVFKDKKLVGKNWQKVCPQIKQKMPQTLFNTSEEKIHQYEARINGRDYLFTYCTIPAHDAVHIYGADITERKWAEEALRSSKEFIETVFNSTNESISVIDTSDFKIVKANRAFLNTLNMQEKDVTGKYCYEVTHHRSKPCEPPDNICPLVETVKTGDFASAEHIHYDKEGRKIYMEVLTSPIRNERGEVCQVVHFVRDITARKQAEETLRLSEEKYRLVVEHANEAIIVVQDGRMKLVNPKTMEITGYSEEELTSKPFIEFIYPDDREMVAERHQRRLRGEEIPHIYSFRIVDKEGNIKWLDINAVMILWGGRPATLNFLNDITERKRAEEALRQSEEKYRTLFEESKDAVFISTPEGKFLDINPATIELFGYSSKEELLQVDIAQDLYFNPKDREAFQKTLSEQGFVKDYELVLKRKDGEKLILLETTTPVRDNTGKIIAYRGILRDMTEHKKLEEQLLHAQKMETIGTLASGVAHDFNNLLTVILGNAEFGMQDSKPSDPVYQEFIEIEKAATQARDLTNQLLSFSRRQVYNPELLNLNKTIDDLLKMLKRIIGEDIELKINLAPKLATIWADPGQIQQVLMNLCTNARDAMPLGGQLILATRFIAADQIKRFPLNKNKPGNYVQLTITDTGVGMDKKTQSRLFDPFFTTKEVGKGTGLGLAVVYGIVKQHDGHIEVTSELGKGTTFNLYFPAVSESEESVKKKKIKSVRRGKETILVVEDDDTVRKVAVRILKLLGYSVLTARDGKEALEVFEANLEKIRLVIMDMVMPKVGGPEVYKKLVTLKPILPVLFVTGYGYDATFEDLGTVKNKNIKLLQKPYTMESLGQKVRELLDN